MAQLPFPTPSLTDGVIELRVWLPGDVGFVVEACQDPEVSRYSPVIPFPYTEADALGWFETHQPTQLAGDGIDFAVCEVRTGQPLGAISFNKINGSLDSAEVGYWLARWARGHGYMTRAVRLLASWGFDDLGLARLELETVRACVFEPVALVD
jgi:RimJ/RimL family protein N-acetyltransferase